MCFSEQASIVSFTAGILGSALCFSLGTIPDKVGGFFLGYVSLMQGIEFLLWRHQICDDYNRILSIASMVFVNTQPIVLGLIILYFAGQKMVSWRIASILALISIYTLVITGYSIPFLADTSNQCILKNKTNHLQWKWNTREGSSYVYTLYIITICCLFILGVKYGVFFAGISLFSLLTSKILYPDSVVGSLWCYYVAFLPILYFIARVSS